VAAFALAIVPADLERAIRQAMQSHEYDWRLPPPPGTAAKPSWLLAVADHVVAGVRSLIHSVIDLLSRLFKWLFRGGVPAPRAGGAPATALHWSLYALTAVAIAAAAWMAWRMLRAGRPAARSTLAPASAIRLDAEDLTADRLPEEEWIELGERSLGEGRQRLALRAFYLGSLAWLGRREYLAIHAGKTNREYELELRRRTRGFPAAHELFGANTAAFDRAWYGMHEVSAADVSDFRARIEAIKAALAPAAGAAA